MRRKSDRNQNENKPYFKKQTKNKNKQCLYSGMANSQPPNQPACNFVALISVTGRNSPRQRLQEAMEMNLKSRPDITCRTLVQVTPSNPSPSLFKSQLQLLPRARLPRPRPRGPGRSDLAGPEPRTPLRAPCRQPLRAAAAPLRLPSQRLPPPPREISRPLDPSPLSSQVPARFLGTHPWDSGEVGGC